jgi:putative ABC transport system permease protein
MLAQILIAALEQGALLALAVFGVSLAIQVVGFPDLTVDGTFTLGGVVTAVLLSALSRQSAVFLVPAAAFAAGAAAGTLTGLLHTALRLNKLLSGILMMALLYSVNLRVLGRANTGLFGLPTVFRWVESVGAQTQSEAPFLLLIALILCVALGVSCWLLQSRFGGYLWAAGQNPRLVANLGASPKLLTVLGVAWANGCVALCGSLYAQRQESVDVQMGSGTIVWGLAAMVVGQAFIRPSSPQRIILGAVLGSVCYQGIIAAGLRLGVPASDLKGATAILVMLVVGVWARRFGASVEQELRAQ